MTPANGSGLMMQVAPACVSTGERGIVDEPAVTLSIEEREKGNEDEKAVILEQRGPSMNEMA
jgi:hypothetical protein